MLAEQRALLVRVEPCLAAWAELCACAELQERLARGERIADELPRLLGVKNWGDLLAWHAHFQALEPGCAARAAETLASTLDLVEAFDDRSLIAEMVRIAGEQRVLVAARTFLEAGWLDASVLRAALEPRLRRAATPVRGEQLVLNEVRSLFALYDQTRLEGASALLEGGSAELEPLLEYLGTVEPALALARLPAPEYHRLRPVRSLAEDPGRSFVNACSNAFDRLHRQRSIVALFRVALAIEEQRESSGALPATLDELAGSFADGVPADPLTAGPFPWTVESGRGRLGPTACPLHGSSGRKCDWPRAVEELAAFEF